ncbi:MAG: hypothetical protein ACXVB0_10535 [Mucilaginibacter sp.]
MKTTNRDRVASLVLKYLLHFLSAAGFYFLLLYTTTSFWLHQLLDKFTKIPYVSTENFHDQMYHLLIIYTLFCYFANNFILNLYESGKGKQLIYSIIADMLVLPIGILIMIIYNNIALKGHPALDNSVYNIYVITALLVIKEAIAIKLVSGKKSVSKR